MDSIVKYYGVNIYHLGTPVVVCGHRKEWLVVTYTRPLSEKRKVKKEKPTDNWFDTLNEAKHFVKSFFEETS